MKSKSKDVEIIEQDNLKIISNNNFIIVYNETTQELNIQSNIKLNLDFCKDLSLNVQGDLDINVDGEFNLYSNNDIAIDSKCLWLNSQMTKQHLGREFKKWYHKASNEEIEELEENLKEY